MTDDAVRHLPFRHVRAVAPAIALVVGCLFAQAQAFSLRSTQDGSRPLGVTIDRSRQPGFVDFAGVAARQAEERRLRALAETIVRAWQTGTWRKQSRSTPTAVSAVSAMQRSAGRPTVESPPASFIATPPKIVRLDDNPLPDTRVIRGGMVRRPRYVQHITSELKALPRGRRNPRMAYR